MRRDDFDLPWEQYVQTLKPHERPMLPGSPAAPDHEFRFRMAYAATGVLTTLTGALGAAVVTANSTQLAGALGASTIEAAWLPVVYVMTNTCMNLLLLKVRVQYGLRLFSRIVLPAFVAVSAAQLLVHDLAGALTVRALAGICAAGISTLGFIYLLQAFPAEYRRRGLVLGIGLSGFALPLARLFSVHIIDIGEWRSLYLFELGLAVMSLAAIFALRLPPSERMKVFDPLDLVTFSLFAPGVALLCAALGLGYLVWWTEAAWVGWALCGAIVLLAAAFAIEHARKTPLINLRWMAGPDIIRLALSILLVRIVLSEQTSGAVGFLQRMGLGPDQLHGLYWIVLAAMAAGTIASSITLNVDRLWAPVATSLFLIAVAALLDSHATALTRPHDLYLSQSLMAFASALFIGPAMLIGIGQVLQKGGFQNMVSFFVVFTVGQNVGGLAGSAIVGTVQILREKFHDNQLAEGVNLGDPDVVLRLQQLAGAYAHVIGDPAQRSTQALNLLQQQITQQANVLAYNDVFLLIAIAALIGGLWTTFVHFRPRLVARRLAASQARAASAQ